MPRLASILLLPLVATGFVLPSRPSASLVLFDRPQGSFRYDNSESISPAEKKKALQDTASWCLDRCIKLGHCEVFEDLNKMSTAQVSSARSFFRNGAR